MTQVTSNTTIQVAGQIMQQYASKQRFELCSDFRSRDASDMINYNKFFKNQPRDFKGTYLELGAFDGKRESNTIFYDHCLGWKGLLIEGGPQSYKLLIKNRSRQIKGAEISGGEFYR